MGAIQRCRPECSFGRRSAQRSDAAGTVREQRLWIPIGWAGDQEQAVLLRDCAMEQALWRATDSGAVGDPHCGRCGDVEPAYWECKRKHASFLIRRIASCQPGSVDPY